MTDDILMKLHVHNRTKVIYIQYKFHEISFIGNLVMAEDVEGWKDGWMCNAKPLEEGKYMIDLLIYSLSELDSLS